MPKQLAPLLATAFVIWGAWNAFTDCFPFNELPSRPSWYLYGWPICFATSGRGRFNFAEDFDVLSLVVDSLVVLIMVASTFVATQTLTRNLPRLSLRHLFAIVFGAAFVFAFWSGRFDRVWEWAVGSHLPDSTFSEVEGELRPTSRLSPFVSVPLAVGVFCIGFTLFVLASRVIRHLAA